MTDKEKQHARQFLTAALFKTYDAILALVKSVEKDRKKKGMWRGGEPLLFTGSLENIAKKKTGACSHTESRHVKQLVTEGWLIKIAGQRRSDGSFGSKQYRVVTVEEWLTTHAFVPKSRKKNDALRKTNARRHLKRIGVPVEPNVDAVVLSGLVVPWHTVEQNTSPTVEHNTSPTVAQDTSTAVAQDTSTAVAHSCVPTVAQDCARKFVSLPVTLKPTHPSLSARVSENLCSYKQITKWIPNGMRVATKAHGEKAQIDTLIAEHGGAKFLAALLLYWNALPDQESKLGCKWTAFLDSIDGWLHDVTPAMLERQAEEHWREENPAEWQRQQEASEARQTQEIIARRDNRPAVSEVSLEDFMESK